MRAHEVTADTVEVELRADRRDPHQLAFGDRYRADECPSRGDALRQCPLGLGPLSGERRRRRVEVHSPAHDPSARLHVARTGDLHAEAEAVEQLRAELTLLGVHGAHEQEARVLHDADPIALDGHLTRGGSVQQGVDEVVAQQVDLVDVEHAAVGAAEQAGLDTVIAGQGGAQVEGPDQPVQRRTERQLHQRGRGVGSGRPPEHGCQRAHGRRLRGAPFTPHEHAPDHRVHGAHEQRLHEVLLTDDRRQGICGATGARRHQAVAPSS